MRTPFHFCVQAGLALSLLAGGVRAAETPKALTAETLERPVRFKPTGQDFVVENGTARFNRPLYGPHTAFRVDAGERPEFGFYLPRKGGLLLLGMATEQGARWLTATQRITSRYRPGAMVYEIRDAMLSGAILRITAVPSKDAEGLIIRAEITKAVPVDLIWAFGGTSGAVLNDRGGDLIAGKDMADVWQFREDDFVGGTFTVTGPSFEYQGKGGRMTGASIGAKFSVGDFTARRSIDALLTSKPGKAPMIVGRTPLKVGVPSHLAIQVTGATPIRALDLAARFNAAEAERQAVASRVVVTTPDPFINAAAGAIAISADALWQSPQMMHGNNAWRSPLLGWRGPYALDAFGWFDRAREQITGWAAKQNTNADDAPTEAHADPAKNLAANDWKTLHSVGSIPARHYDMNLVFIDMMLRHFRWTGDEALLRQMWPVLTRHLAWEKRLFDRDGLYEAYAAIWASDGLGYNGGGTTHATAYNLLHNRLAAQIAKIIGEDPAPYEQEAQRIHTALHRELWLADRGWYAEYKEALGLKRVHPAAALWTIYHAIDSEVGDAMEDYQALRYVETQFPRIPIRGPGVPEGDWYALSSSTWMPYEWSLNNVVLAEMAHMALAYWQGGRGDEAWKLWKGALLDSMYQGSSPGNLSNLSALDVHRGETYRDFGDPTGIVARSLVEGLFGIVPDALSGQFTLRPGFPREWEQASIRTPYLDYAYRHEKSSDSFTVTPKFPKPLRLRLQCRASSSQLVSVMVNGQAATWKNVETAVGQPTIEIQAEPAAHYDVVIQWGETPPPVANYAAVTAVGRSFRLDVGTGELLDIADPQGVLKDVSRASKGLRATIAGKIGARTFFVKTKKDDIAWWMPIDVEVRAPLELVQLPNRDAERVRFKLRNNTPNTWDKPLTVQFGHLPVTTIMRAPAMRDSEVIALPTAGQLPGTNAVAFDLGAIGRISDHLTNWQSPLPGGANTPSWQRVDLAPFFNDRVTQIFQHEYLTPRPATTSLQIPKQGIGNWSSNQVTFKVDDSGLRKAAGPRNEFRLASGIPFQTPSAEGAKNVMFTSRWDNFPAEIAVPLAGSGRHLYLLMAGSTNPMQTQIDNGEVVVTYKDGTTTRLALTNPTTWWPIEQDYFTDDYAFRYSDLRPLRVELGTGKVYQPTAETKPVGGAATVLDLSLDPAKTLQSLTVRALSTEVIIGLMSATLVR
jgi:hypothetical protein